MVPTISLGANRLGSRLELRTRGNFAHLSREAGSLHDRLLAIMMSEFAGLVPNQYIVEFGSTQSAHFSQVAPPLIGRWIAPLPKASFAHLGCWLRLDCRRDTRIRSGTTNIDAAETVAAAVARPFLPRNKDALKLFIGA